MAYCKKCGAYIPIDETACPACGYDPEAEAREARAARERAEAEARAKAAKEAEEARRREQQAESWATQEKKREEEERRRQEQRRRWEQQRQQSGYTGGAAQSQYTSQRTGQSGAAQGQYASQRTGQTWVPPWSEGQSARQSAQSAQSSAYSGMRDQAKESVDNQKLSILSYLGPLVLIPLLTRRDDDFARYHANQGLVLLLMNIIAGAIFSNFYIIPSIISLFDLFCMVVGIRNVLRGKKEPLPLIGKIKLLK